MPKRPTIVSLAAAVLIISATFSNRVSASTNRGSAVAFQSISVNERGNEQTKTGKRKKEFQGVAGIVSSISGSQITLVGKDEITYIVDASNAEVKKKGVSLGTSLADIKSGDKLLIKGVVTGSTVAATEIREGRGRRKV